MTKDLPFFGQKLIRKLTLDEIDSVDMSKFRLSTEGIIRHENDLFEEARLSALQQLERAMGDFVIALPKTDAPVQGKRTGTQDKSIW